MREISVRWRIGVCRLLVVSAGGNGFQEIVLPHHLAATNLDERSAQRLHWIFYEIEDFDNSKLNRMISATHVIAIEHLLIANWCIDQLENTLYSSNSVAVIVSDNVQQFRKYIGVHILQVY